MPKLFKISLIVVSLLVTILVTGFQTTSQAATVTELKAKSSDLSAQIKQLDAEILKINSQLNTTTSQKNTLANELAKIEASRQKLVAELTKTTKQINVSSNNISILANEITGKEKDISADKVKIAEALRQLNNLDASDNFLELALVGTPLSEIVEQVENLAKLQANLQTNIEDLQTNKLSLQNKKSATETEKANLTKLQDQLTDQKVLVEQTKQTKNTLLTQTKNQESTYQAMLQERLDKKKAVETEMADIEKQIQIAIDPNTLPETGTAILSWPVAKVIITQYFGYTSFATQNPQVYNGKGHNGVDFGAAIGTPILAAADGTVVGTGDTDLTCKGASYGRWILIKHNNGLSTLYAHLSVIKVTEGQAVTRGSVIAYSGNTGYTTGPHLHFTVYASAGVQISSLQSKVAGCGVYRMPIASYSSYLNPLSYLPSL